MCWVDNCRSCHAGKSEFYNECDELLKQGIWIQKKMMLGDFRGSKASRDIVSHTEALTIRFLIFYKLKTDY